MLAWPHYQLDSFYQPGLECQHELLSARLNISVVLNFSSFITESKWFIVAYSFLQPSCRNPALLGCSPCPSVIYRISTACRSKIFYLSFKVVISRIPKVRGCMMFVLSCLAKTSWRMGVVVCDWPYNMTRWPFHSQLSQVNSKIALMWWLLIELI